MTDRIAPKSVEYTIVWRWESERGTSTTVVKATTAPRAISTMHRELANEYAYNKSEIIIIAVVPEGF